MSNQYLKLRRSAVPGRIPTTESIDFGEIALNTYDGLAFMKKSGSNGIEVVPIGSPSGSFSGNFTGTFTGSLQGTSSWAVNALTASFAPNYLPLTGGTINGDVTVNGTASIAFLNVTYESASVIYSSGSNQFGDNTDDVQTLIGTVIMSGSQQITGSLNVTSGITGSLFGTASWARNSITSSFVNYISSSIGTEYSIVRANDTKYLFTTYEATNNAQHLYINSRHLFWTGSSIASRTIGQMIAIGGSALESAGIDGSTRASLAVGAFALPRLRIGEYNVGIGVWALEYLTNGQRNTAIGQSAGGGVVTGSFNTFVGAEAGYANNQSSTQNNMIVIGYRAQYTASSPTNNISNTTVIGNNINTSLSNVVLLGRSDQDVIIGNSVSSLISSNPGYKLHVSGSGNFTNGLIVTGSFTVQTGSTEFQVLNTGTKIGNDLSDIHTVTGSLNVNGSITGSLFGTSSWARNSISTSYAINAATSSNILGGKATHVPYFITDTTLATSSIYQSGSSTVIINQDAATEANPEALYVWQPSTSSINVISGKGNLDNYLQLNIQNTNQGPDASSDIVATANNGNENINYIDMGVNSENYNGFLGGPNDAYLYSAGEDLWIGNYSDGKNVYFFNSSSEAALITLTPSNDVDINTRLNAPNITGSLEGTSSWAKNTISSSHAVNSDFAGYAQTAGIAANGGVTQLIAGSGVSLIPSTGIGNVTVIATGVGGITILSGSNVTQSFSNSNTWNFTHNLGVRTPIISVFDSNYNQVIPQGIQLIDTASAIITFPTLESGFAIASVGGVTGNALSSSYSLFATYADTASYYAETDPVFVAKSASLATTGSNTFRGTQIVTGSLFTSGSNTLIGNTILSGSIGISGSSTIQGTTTMSGSLSISGSTTQTGNNTLIGTTTLTGSIFINGNIIPEVSSSFDLGSLTNPWRSIYVQSGSISIQSDIPGGIPATISNANGNVTFVGAGFQLKSGSFVPFEVNSQARTVIRVPNLPANDIGGFSIIGSSTGVYQPVTNAGGLLHLTSNDEQSARLTIDAFGSGSFVSYVNRKARGTAASPLPVQAGDVMFRMATVGWTGNGYGISTPGVAAATTFEIVALDNFTTSSIGSRMHFYNAPSGSVTRTLSATIDTTGITIPSSSRLFGTASWANNAQTASYVRPLVQDVIITGSLKVSGSLTEIGDTVLSGSLTLSSGSALRINNGFYVDGNRQYNYGQFSSTQTQSGSADTAYSMTFDITDFAQGVSLVSGSRITVANTGIYNIQFSSQLHTTANQAVDFSIWFAMTGSNIANSNTDYTVEKIAGGGYAVAALNFLTQISSGSYVELKYSKTTTQGQLIAKGIQAAPARPATPSVILTVTQIA